MIVLGHTDVSEHVTSASDIQPTTINQWLSYPKQVGNLAIDGLETHFKPMEWK